MHGHIQSSEYENTEPVVSDLPKREHIEAKINDHHLPDNVFKCIFLNENIWISIKTSLIFFPKGAVIKYHHMVSAYIPWYFTRQSAGKPGPRRGVVSMLGHQGKYHGKYATTNMVMFLYHVLNLIWLILNSLQQKTHYISCLTRNLLEVSSSIHANNDLHDVCNASMGQSAPESESAGRHTWLNIRAYFLAEYSNGISITVSVTFAWSEFGQV